jgi:hypothetical protein
MYNPTLLVIDPNVARSTNNIPSADAEAGIGGANWTQTNCTKAAAAFGGPFGTGGAPFASTLTTTASSAADTMLTTSPANFSAKGKVLSVFVLAGTGTELTLDLWDSANSLQHSVRFTVSAGVWSVSTITGGAIALPIITGYDGGWVRLAIEFTPKTDAGLTASNSAIKPRIRLSPTAGHTVSLWGAHMAAPATLGMDTFTPGGGQTSFDCVNCVPFKKRDATTGNFPEVWVGGVLKTLTTDYTLPDTGTGRTVLLNADPGATNIVVRQRNQPACNLVTPYLTGQRGNTLGQDAPAEQGYGVFATHKQESGDLNCLVQIYIPNTAATVQIWGRASSTAPWTVLTTAMQNGGGTNPVDATTKSIILSIDCMPEIRAVTTINDLTGAPAAWVIQ